MSSLRAIERRALEDLFDMGGGYVLDLTNDQFSDLLLEHGVVIYDDEYASRGNSKANRLRSLWDNADDELVANVLVGLLEWRASSSHYADDFDASGHQRVRDIIARLTGEVPVRIANTEDEFLRRRYDGLSVSKIDIELALVPVLEARLAEAQQCFPSAPLATIFMCGSILEGILLGVARNQPEAFNRSTSAPTDRDGKVKTLHEWSLAQLIDAAHGLGIVSLDVKKFSHSLRDFRNYIHPYQQLAAQFTPDAHTAEICLQVLKAAVADLSGERTGELRVDQDKKPVERAL